VGAELGIGGGELLANVVPVHEPVSLPHIPSQAASPLKLYVVFEESPEKVYEGLDELCHAPPFILK
jgi:hypothetical protein